jgi:hypothetical protein
LRAPSVVMLSKIMSNVTCSNCGAALIAGAKFCRQCGRVVNSVSAPSVTEATTRTLHTPAEFGAQPTDFLSPQPTSPAYMAPGQVSPPPAYMTNNLERTGQKPNVWVISLLATMIVLALVAFGLIAYVKSRSITPPPPATIPEPPTVERPGIPPPPPPPGTKAPTGRVGINPINRDFIYPGAETMMDLTRANGGSLLQLRTNDAYAKVLDWYMAKLNPKSVIKSGGANAILKSDEVMAIITAAGPETSIMLKELDASDREDDR